MWWWAHLGSHRSYVAPMTCTSYSMLQSPCHLSIRTLATIQAKVEEIGYILGACEGA